MAPCRNLRVDRHRRSRHSTHAAVLPSLAYLIANLPPQTRVIVTTHDIARRVPVDPADRRLTIIDREQLQATPDEAALIACASAPGLDVNSVEEIAAAADGWVAAIRAAARYARQHPQGHAAYWLTSQGAAALLAPWLDRLPAARRQFLIDTLALDWLAGPLCDSTLEASGSLEALEDLEARGSYLTPVLPPTAPADPPLRWWRRHPLVTAALTQAAPLVDQSERNLRAASWFMDRGSFEPAMHHLMAAGRLEEAGRYLSAHENALFEGGRGTERRRLVREPAGGLLGPAGLAPRAHGMGPGDLPRTPCRRNDPRSTACPSGRLPRRGHGAASP